jgi:hypothetical protein
LFPFLFITKSKRKYTYQSGAIYWQESALYKWDNHQLPPANLRAKAARHCGSSEGGLQILRDLDSNQLHEVVQSKK